MKKSLKYVILLMALLTLIFAFLAISTYLQTSPKQQDIQGKDKENISIINDASFMILDQYQELFKQNKDMIGWIKIDNTKVDYPVMYTPYDYNYYLRRDFNDEESVFGLPYIGAHSSVDTDCVIIHGHNTIDGSMFGDLSKYKKVDFFNNNKIIKFDTLYQEREYQVFAVVETKILKEDEIGFKYYEQGKDLSDLEYLTLVNWLIYNSLHEVSDIPKDQPQILLLSTCGDIFTSDKRFVVAAYRIN